MINKALLQALLTAALTARLPAAPLLPPAVTIEEHLQVLEKQVQSLTDENKDLRRQLGWKNDEAPVVPQPGGHEMRQESFDPDTATRGNTFRTTTFGLNYYLKGDAMKFMVDYLDGSIPGSGLNGGRLLTRVQVTF